MIDVVVPSPGESISEVEITNWLKKTGDYVKKDEEICEIDSDKATLTVSAEASGILEILVEPGTVEVGAVIAKIDTSAAAPAGIEVEVAKPAPVAEIAKPVENPTPNPEPSLQVASAANYAAGTPSPAAAKMMAENNIAAEKVSGTGPNGRITKQDILQFLSSGFQAPASEIVSNSWQGSRDMERKKMTALRKKLSQRLVSVKNETAMLTTFNEVDMTAILELRKKYADKFKEKHNIGLGFMSFFTKAVTEALYHFPAVNSMIDGDEQLFHNYVDVGIAVSAPKGLMVPVIRNAESLTLAQIEEEVKRLAIRARDGKITPDEMTGGTFTITNGGVFGSLMSTPILNPPQSGILGMHKVQERPVVINGKIEIRPMMYIALSYDHRVIDGRESVGFLVKVKEMIEDPNKMLFGSRNPEEILLGL
jgi:2-oxoglutarate dehydrogenase E2 component (dihydrolipoamide succinyltransferase)